MFRRALATAVALLLACLSLAVASPARAAVDPTAPVPLSGRVLAPKTFLPAAGATVTLEPGDVQTTTDAEGRYSFNGIPVGVYTVSATLDGECPAVSNRKTLEIDGQGVVFEIYLYEVEGACPPEEEEEAPPPSLGGLVLSEETGSIVAGAVVTLEPGGGRTVTDEDGWFHFPGLTVGGYVLTVTGVGPCGATVSREVTLGGVQEEWVMLPASSC